MKRRAATRRHSRAVKSATSSRLASADSRIVADAMYASGASAPTHGSLVTHVRVEDQAPLGEQTEPGQNLDSKSVKSPLRFEAWSAGLQDHPDREFVKLLLDGIVHGVDIGYKGPRIHRVHNNWPSVEEHRLELESIILQDILRGRVLGPFNAPPTSGFMGNPLGAFTKKRSSKVRVIHDLSWPPERSVNDYISRDQFTLQYIKFDDIVSVVKNQGRNSFMAKLDLESAFKHVLVKKEQWEVLGFTLKDICENGLEKLRYYMCTCLPFGLRSSPKLFDIYAQGLEYIMLKNGVTYVCHYADDSFTVSHDYATCKRNLNIMLETCSTLGLSVQYSKLIKPSTCVEMLGIIIDSELMQLRISNERLSCIKNELLLWSHKKSCTKRQLLSLIGKLEFLCRVVRHGRSFLRRLIELSKKVKLLHHKLRLNCSAKCDIKWWVDLMPRFHGISMMYDENWISSDKLQLWTDASDHGIGCVYKNQYIYQRFDDNMRQKPIAWRELFAIVTAAATWGHYFISKRVMFNCDNEVVVYCLSSGVSRDTELMTLIRKLLFIGACNNFECSSSYLPSKSNMLADALSRGQVEKFLKNCDKNCKMIQCKPVDILCDLNNYR